MTLYKQLAIGMIAVFLMLMTSVFFIELTTTRHFLKQQQESEVSNTINTVGLALAPYLKDDDTVAVESVINALFDGSSYSVVRLVFLDNNEEIVRNYPIQPNNVPSWFTDINLFSPIHDKRVVTSGWLQLAEIEIVSHTGSAYQQMWFSFTNLLSLFSGIFIIGILAIGLILKRALHPLTLIVKKMEQIADNQFDEPLKPPKTKDLIAVVNGINTMSAQVELSFKEQAQEAQLLRTRAYVDPVSQLGNRAFYLAQLNQWLNESAIGGVAVLQAQYISDEYTEKGYECGDRAIQELASQLKSSISSPGLTIARISSYEFAFILPNINESEIKLIAENIIASTKAINIDPTGMAKENISLGVISNKQYKDSSDILALVDNSLASAKAAPELEFSFISGEEEHITLGKQQWKSLVEEAISNEWVNFRYQIANDKQGNIFHSEVFSSIDNGNEKFSANQYLFALEQLNSTDIFDQFVIETIIQKISHGDISQPIAINISSTSVSQPSFIRWLEKTLTKNAKAASLLHFEIPENSFIQDPHYCALLCNAIRLTKAKFGVDGYGRDLKSLDYISEFRPHYVKLDYFFSHNIEDEQHQFTLSSICRTAHNLGIVTIASRIETQEQLDVLAENFVEVFQGFIVDK
ncbi:diguanylate cyclase [Vibrio sp. 10N.286.49.B3]|uniref:bifunctional diguanylate cyclase/phosphodiesterase n=1 Tax=Vibrio sp. 10N.286.49.B3 TaxID=1880855 RepID=UPI000C81A20B|nr:EAL domain-containing protein [Vibrio sp. 10N.286.49.B3]PMH43107.1 diguanylate cyclase [Vibrio sp. 10N.286.49.B3]